MDRESQNTSSPRKATQVDQEWRGQGNTTPRKATQIDQGWRSQGNPPSRKATQIDPNWRNQGAITPQKKATQVDPNWRAQKPTSVQKATQADPNWRAVAENVVNQADLSVQNPFMDIRSFQSAAAGLTELVAASGKHYRIKRTLSKEGGQSAILLCADPEGRDVVAKLFFGSVDGSPSAVAARTRVLEYMQSQEGKKYTLAVIDNGQTALAGGRCYFEITPYCREGDLSHEPPLPFEIIAKLVQYFNEVLHSMHTAGILHRDIKPENIYKLSGRIVLGDFGIARLANAVATGYSPGTDGYRAPESLMAVSAENSVYFFDEKCDYYSLGVTLGSLFEGHFVYEKMDARECTIAIRNGRLPLSRMDPHRDQLENLLNGLCAFDSKYRFGYEEVKHWIADHNYMGCTPGDEWPRPLRMLGEIFGDEEALFRGITKDEEHWEEGKALLFNKYFEDFFRSFRPDIARSAQTADELWRTVDKDKGLSVFLKSLYAPGAIVWKGRTFTSLRELGNKMVSTQTPVGYGMLLQKQVVSHWLEHTTGISVDEKTKSLVAAMEADAVKEPEIACYWFGNCFAAKRHMSICGHVATNIPSLVKSLFGSPRDFYLVDGMAKLLDRQVGADLYGFLYSFNCKKISDSAWEQARYCDQFGVGSILFSMMEAVALQAGGDGSIVRRFYQEYGPVGIASYTKHLVAGRDKSIYSALDTEGKQILSEISTFSAGEASTVDAIFRAYEPLARMVEKMEKVLEHNPHLILAGAYNGKSILCHNLSGCFAFEIWGKRAPLGFSSWIEHGNGGEMN